jgi:phage gp16-like protein
MARGTTYLRVSHADSGTGEKHWAWAKKDAKPDEIWEQTTRPLDQVERDLIDALRARAADGLPQ